MNFQKTSVRIIGKMQISYMRIAIYFLTFVTYAYSGYGSAPLAHLRDALIAAEAIFSDFFYNVITVVKKFRTVHEVLDTAVEEACLFMCPCCEHIGQGLYMKSSLNIKNIN